MSPLDAFFNKLEGAFSTTASPPADGPSGTIEPLNAYARKFKVGKAPNEEGSGVLLWVGGFGGAGLLAMVAFTAMRIQRTSSRTRSLHAYGNPTDAATEPDVDAEEGLE